MICSLKWSSLFLCWLIFRCSNINLLTISHIRRVVVALDVLYFCSHKSSAGLKFQLPSAKVNKLFRKTLLFFLSLSLFLSVTDTLSLLHCYCFSLSLFLFLFLCLLLLISFSYQFVVFLCFLSFQNLGKDKFICRW